MKNWASKFAFKFNVLCRYAAATLEVRQDVLKTLGIARSARGFVVGPLYTLNPVVTHHIA